MKAPQLKPSYKSVKNTLRILAMCRYSRWDKKELAEELGVSTKTVERYQGAIAEACSEHADVRGILAGFNIETVPDPLSVPRSDLMRMKRLAANARTPFFTTVGRGQGVCIECRGATTNVSRIDGRRILLCARCRDGFKRKGLL